MKVFITGITGFVGAGLARGMLEDGAEVHGLIRPESNLWRLADIQDQLYLHEGDLLNRESIFSALHAASANALLHLGVYGAYPTQRDTRSILNTSILGTMNLLDAAKETGVEMIINTGSSSEYGRKSRPMREDEIIEPNSYYAVGKAAQTLFCQQFAREEKIPVITLRLELGWRPARSFDTSFQTTVSWYEHHVSWIEAILKQSEEVNSHLISKKS